MASRSTRPAAQGEVNVTKDGRSYTANWGVSGGVITVWNLEFGERSTQLGGSQAGGEEALARLLLSEMIP